MQSPKSSVFDKCQYVDCDSNARDGVRLFRFPGIQDPRQLIWVKHTGNLRLKGWTPSSIRRAGLCAKHFRPEDLMENSKGKTKLRRGCYPIPWEESHETGKKVDEYCLQTQGKEEELYIQRGEQVKTYPPMRNLWTKKENEDEEVKDIEFIDTDVSVEMKSEERHQIKVEMREEEINIEHKDEEPVTKRKYIYIIETNSPKTLEIGKKEEKRKNVVVKQGHIDKYNKGINKDEDIRENKEDSKVSRENDPTSKNKKIGDNGVDRENGINRSHIKIEVNGESEQNNESEIEDRTEVQAITEKSVVQPKKYIYIIYKRRKGYQGFQVA